MSHRYRSRCLSSMVMLALFAVATQAGLAQEVRARVVDEQSRNALVGVAATLLTSDSSEVAWSASGPDGFFTLAAPGPGSFLVRVEHLGYEVVFRSVRVGESGPLVPAFVLRTTAIALDTLEVEASRGEVSTHGVVGFSRPSHLLSGERMAVLETTGVSFLSAVRELGAGLRFRDVMIGERSFTCIESTRHTQSFRGGGGEETAAPW